jgi:hypothetical protein
MRLFIICFLVGNLFVFLSSSPARGAGDEYENLEFFLERTLKETEMPDQRNEILNRYAIKALGLLYKQNNELINLNRKILMTMEQLLRVENEERRELENQLRELRNQLPRR